MIELIMRVNEWACTMKYCNICAFSCRGVVFSVKLTYSQTIARNMVLHVYTFTRCVRAKRAALWMSEWVSGVPQPPPSCFVYAIHVYRYVVYFVNTCLHRYTFPYLLGRCYPRKKKNLRSYFDPLDLSRWKRFQRLCTGWFSFFNYSLKSNRSFN